MAATRDLREMVHRKQIEILRAVEDAIEQQQQELWRLRKSLADALHRVDCLLNADEAGAALPEANPARAPAPGPVPVLTSRYDELASAPVAQAAGDPFPRA